ncbi:MAG: glutamate-5-semialdehyde dehydrogenase [Rickettsiales bacterium]|nr:glutamate-5-semialdehyde dehydrogenase [Rickettsiales bacterium]
MIEQDVTEICKNSKTASYQISSLSSDIKNSILKRVSELMTQNIEAITKENDKDILEAQKNNLEAAKIDRLKLDKDRILGIANSINDVITLNDPVGEITFNTQRPSGINVKRVRVPIGVLLTIYESRPNVTSDVAALCLKSGNAAILRCGSDSINSSTIIASLYRQSLKEHNIDENVVTLISNTDREYVTELLKQEKYIDIVIPRGGKSLIKAIMQNTKIPVIKHLDGNCHCYVHEDADFDKAIKIIHNAKLRRVGICGATESVVVDKKVAKEMIPAIVKDLTKEGCEMRGDSQTKELCPEVTSATDEDFYTEYLDKIISIKVVNNIEEAIKHINQHSSSHTESIITENQQAAQKFLNEIDSANVMLNTSTQFADGGEFGLGAEVGISTGKLHARGPVGLEQLTTYKYQVIAECATRK